MPKHVLQPGPFRPLGPLSPFILLFLLCLPASAAGPAHLVKDVRPGLDSFDPDLSESAFHGYAPTTGGVVFFSRQAPGGSLDSLECGLWVTDGAGRAERLADLCATDSTLAPTGLYMLGSSGSVALLTNAAGRLWRTDGTAAGTYLLADVEPSILEGLPTLGPDGRTLFFQACADGSGCEPWITDGTRQGTRLLLDVAPVFDSSYPTNFLPYGDRMIFTADGGLWSSDGTARGTVLLVQTLERPDTPVFHGGKIYFVSTSSGPNHRDDIWVYDPETGASLLLKRFRSGFFAASLTVAGGRVLIRHTDDTSYISSLWETDGTVEGTRPVGPGSTYGWMTEIRDVTGGAVFAAERVGGTERRLYSLSPAMRSPAPLKGCPDGCPKPAFNTLERGVVLNGNLYFEGCLPPARGRGVWVTDGTARGTRQVKELSSEDCDNNALTFRVELGRVLFLDGEGALWATDGSEAGTVRLARTGDLPSPFFPPDLAVWESRVFFTGVDPRRGPQPFVSDLTSTGTGPAARLGGVFGAASGVTGLATLGRGALFAACDGREEGIWTSDGIPAGTFQLPGTGTGSPCGEPPSIAFIRVGDLAFFSWKDRLWRTDGTAAGTMILARLPAGSLATGAELGGRLLFAAGPPNPGDGGGVTWTFWTSDGTPEGTRRMFTFRFGAPPTDLVTAGGLVYFRAYPVEGNERDVWRTDGTAAGTFPILRDESLYEEGPLQIVRFRGRTWLLASHREIEDEPLRVTDGTEAGTVPVTSALPYGLAVFRGSLCYFSGYPLGLWCSDGTDAGSHLVKELSGLVYGAPPPELTVAGNRLFFRLNDGVHGLELWASDGTEAGTGLVKDIVPGAAGSRPDELTAAGGRLYFAANDGEHGRELWTSDGTPAGTRIVQDLFPGLPSSAPTQLTPGDGILYFTADDGRHGREPWALPLP